MKNHLNIVTIMCVCVTEVESTWDHWETCATHPAVVCLELFWCYRAKLMVATAPDLAQRYLCVPGIPEPSRACMSAHTISEDEPHHGMVQMSHLQLKCIAVRQQRSIATDTR